MERNERYMVKICVKEKKIWKDMIERKYGKAMSKREKDEKNESERDLSRFVRHWRRRKSEKG